MGVKYGEFKFPSDKGFTGSAGKTMVKGYARGGMAHADEAMDKKLVKQMVKPAAMKAKGGKVHEDEAMDKKLIERMVKPAARKAGGGRACG